MLRTRLLTGPGMFEELEHAWRSLLPASSTATPFQTWEWQSQWYRTFGGSKTPLAFTVWEGEDLVGLMSFTRTRGVWRALRPMGLGPSDYLHPLAANGYEDLVADHVADYLSGNHEVDLIDLHQIRETQPLASKLDPKAGQDQAACLVLDLPATYDEYLAMLGKSLRYDVRRLDKSPFKEGRAVIKTYDANNVQEGMDAFYELHNARWKARGQFWGGAFQGRAVAFHRQWAHTAACNGWLRLSVMSLDTKPVGAIYAMALGDTAYFYQAGFDPNQGNVSPGTLMVAHTIRRSIEDGLKHFDFMRGDEPYKRRWKPQHALANRRILFPAKGALGRCGVAWNELGSRVESRVRQRLEGRGLS